MFPLKDNIPTRRFPVLTVGLIAANVLVFIFFQEARFSLGGASVDPERVIEFGSIPYEVTHPGEQCAAPEQLAGATGSSGGGPGLVCGPADAVEARTGESLVPVWITVLTSMFMHGGILHLAGNMLFLWIFGNNVEDSMGRLRFVAFYLLGGAVALGAQTALNPDAMVPTIGASGAVAAVLGGYALLYPRARVVTLVIIIFFITLIELPALLVLGLWFVLQLLYAGAEAAQPVGGEGGGVAYFAHVGGFVFGLLLIKLFANKVHDDYDAEQRRIPVY
ncbi:MAG TPA: rhomboid family intramembrane serine protease [Thermoleophilaceae bacterium]|nr:rhomboid family intramembrane serine protease [Thermoleophilaceae bacterium]